MIVRKIILSLFIITSLTACANHSCCGNDRVSTWKDGSNSYSSCGPRGCYSKRGLCSDCQCSDIGRYHNTCMSQHRYCEAFGNPGGR